MTTRFPIAVFMCAAFLTFCADAAAADEFGARFRNIEPAAMADFPASRLNDINPAAGPDQGDMDSYVRGLFGSDMNGAQRINREYEDSSKKPSIVRIYADPL